MKRLIWLIVGVLMLTAALSVSAQGAGVLVEGTNDLSFTADAFNPTMCSETVSACRRLMEKVYPSLFAVDPETGLLQSGEDGNYGVVSTPTLVPDETWTLRRDLMWSDGTPVTAYDVFFTWAARGRYLNGNMPVSAMQIVDDYTLAVEYPTEDCATLPRANFHVLPSQFFAPGLRQYLDNHQSEGLQSLSDWLELQDFEFNFTPLLNSSSVAPPTAGRFAIAEVRPNEEIRLTADDLAYILRPVNGDGTTEFLNGDIDLLVNPPVDRRADLRATNGLQIAEPASESFDYIMFNVANSQRPRSAFYESGAPIEQGTHRIFASRDVRRAFQLAIDIDEVIRVAFQGDAVALASSLPPTSRGYDASLAPLRYDPREAEALLEAAGWKDIDGNGYRECIGCETASENTSLSFVLSFQSGDHRELVAERIAEQLYRVGFDVSISNNDFPQGQDFDVYLGGMQTDADPDQWLRFSREGDVLQVGPNITSYHDDELSALLDDARNVPSCEPDARAALYRDAQALIQEQQPYAFLYTRTAFIVAQPNVVGFNPIAGDPFWNIADWRVIQ